MSNYPHSPTKSHTIKNKHQNQTYSPRPPYSLIIGRLWTSQLRPSEVAFWSSVSNPTVTRTGRRTTWCTQRLVVILLPLQCVTSRARILSGIQRRLRASLPPVFRCQRSTLWCDRPLFPQTVRWAMRIISIRSQRSLLLMLVIWRSIRLVSAQKFRRIILLIVGFVIR